MMPSHDFAFIAGALSLSFVDTLGARAGAPVERLASPESLAVWIEAAGFGRPPRPRPDELTVARDLREAIYRVARALSTQHAAQTADVALINTAALLPPPRPQLGADGRALMCVSSASAVLSVIAADAIETLARAERIRECPECRMLFLDTSPAGKRRWCSSSVGCGNRAKVREHRARRAANNQERNG